MVVDIASTKTTFNKRLLTKIVAVNTDVPCLGVFGDGFVLCLSFTKLISISDFLLKGLTFKTNVLNGVSGSWDTIYMEIIDDLYEDGRLVSGL
jgi:hypothetical protein